MKKIYKYFILIMFFNGLFCSDENNKTINFIIEKFEPDNKNLIDTKKKILKEHLIEHYNIITNFDNQYKSDLFNIYIDNFNKLLKIFSLENEINSVENIKTYINMIKDTYVNNYYFIEKKGKILFKDFDSSDEQAIKINQYYNFSEYISIQNSLMDKIIESLPEDIKNSIKIQRKSLDKKKKDNNPLPKSTNPNNNPTESQNNQTNGQDHQKDVDPIWNGIKKNSKIIVIFILIALGMSIIFLNIEKNKNEIINNQEKNEKKINLMNNTIPNKIIDNEKLNTATGAA